MQQASAPTDLVRIGPKKAAGLVAVVLSAGLLWISTNDLASVLAFALLATGTLSIGALVVRRRRQAAERKRAAGERSRQEYLDNIVEHLDLDTRIIDETARGSRPAVAAPVQVVRAPISRGNGSVFLNRVDVVRADDSRVQLVEKGAWTTSNEVSFWRGVDERDVTLRTERYQSLEPVDLVGDERVSVLYFPYAPGMDRAMKTRRREFRANIETTVSAVADFNGHNLAGSEAHSSAHQQFMDRSRPSQAELQLRLKVPKTRARSLLRSWDHVQKGWPVVRDAYERLPLCLCHNDVSPANTVREDGSTTLADFGRSGIGPVGSDLHTIIRWSDAIMADPKYVNELISIYIEGLCRHGLSMSVTDVQLSAWTTFYLRYSNLKFRSARYERPFTIALDQMRKLIQYYSNSR